MKARPSRLVLFDIDGTLIHSGRAGLRGMNAAFERLHGRADALRDVPFAGRTDFAIVTQAFRNMGVEPSAEAVMTLRDTYFRHLREELLKPMPGTGALPGVAALLDAIETRPDVALGLLTGNFAGGAEIKLGHYGLWQRFGFGAFGDEHADRRDLVPVALEAAERATGVRVPCESVIVIGDTPLDVDCAHAHGALSIAVATGPFSRDQLAESRPRLLLDTLEDVDAVLHALQT